MSLSSICFFIVSLILFSSLFDVSYAAEENNKSNSLEMVKRSLIVNDRERIYYVNFPSELTRNQTLPLIIVLHSHGGSAKRISSVSGMNKAAEERGFIAVYPEGVGWMGFPPRSWNAGNCCGYAKGKQVDDVNFIRVLIAELEGTLPIDADNIFVTGASNGSMLAHRLGCELADKLAGIAVVSGALAVDECSPKEPIPVMIIHGTADKYIPYAGGIGSKTRTGRVDKSVAKALDFWITHNKCNTLPKSNVYSGGIVEESRYSNCAEEGIEVVAYILNGVGHVWPGGRRGWAFGAKPIQAWSATDNILEFFLRHIK